MKDNRGFTLVELLAVIAIIAVLSVVAIATYREINESAKRKALNAKITQLKSAAEKWGRENNITSRTKISVNNLVVEGYVTADEVSPGGLAIITNPLSGENMICNTIDITFENGNIKTKYNIDVQDCNLAKQSLVDTNIDIRVVDSDNRTLSGSGSIAKWTNKNVVIIVNSTNYDPKVTSISYDFEGDTITKNVDELQKYSGTSFISETEAKKYYNTFFISAELILDSKVVVTYDIPGEGTKSRAYTIRFDQEEATATLKTNYEWLTEETPVTVLVDDGKGSGPSKFYLTTTESFDDPNRTETPANYKGTTVESLKVGKYYVWTEDLAGNRSKKYKLIIDINNVDDFVPDCEVVFEGHKGGGHWYKEVPVTPGGKNITPAGVSGVNLGASDNINNKVYTAFAAYTKINTGYGETRTTNTTRAGVPYYCHAKTLAGKYGTNTATLWLDMTPPRLTIEQTSDTEYTRNKLIYLHYSETLSGITDETSIKYGWALAGQQPTEWAHNTLYIFSPGEPDENDFILYGGAGLTGIYYLWVDVSAVQDFAGNYVTGVNEQGTMAVFGPYMFDNTPPVCDGVGGKTNWTNGSYFLTQNCRDDDGTPDQSGCEAEAYYRTYTNADNVRTDTIIIRDNVGLETECPTNVYLDNTKPGCSLAEPEGGPDGRDGWYKSASVTITGSFWDNGNENIQSGVAKIGTGTTNTLNGQNSYDFTENGDPVTARCTVQDVAGNIGTNALNFKKDDGSEANNGGCYMIGGRGAPWSNAPVTWGYKFYTPPISGCYTESGSDNAGSWDFSADCGYTNTVTWGSNRGFGLTGGYVGARSANSGAVLLCPISISLYIDTFPPECQEVTGDSTTWQRANRTVTVGCKEVQEYGNTAFAAELASFCTQDSFSKTFDTTTEVGYIPIGDNAGNVRQCPVNVYVDKSGPSCGTTTGESTEWATGSRTITVQCSDAESGCSQNSYSSTFNTTGRTGTITISDVLGNTTNCSVNTYIDNNSPVAECSKSNTDTTSGVTCTVTCTDVGSGCDSSGAQGTHTGLKSSKTYSVEDKVGHTDFCTCYVNSYDCNCSNCYTGSNTCVGGYYWNCAVGSCFEDAEEGAVCYTNPSCVLKYSDCLTGENTCKYGCASTCYR